MGQLIDDLSFLELHFNVISGLIEEIAVVVGDGVTDFRIVYAKHCAGQITIVDIFDETGIDFPYVPITGHGVLAFRDVVERAFRQIADFDEGIGCLRPKRRRTK